MHKINLIERKNGARVRVDIQCTLYDVILCLSPAPLPPPLSLSLLSLSLYVCTALLCAELTSEILQLRDLLTLQGGQAGLAEITKLREQLSESEKLMSEATRFG